MNALTAEHANQNAPSTRSRTKRTSMPTRSSMSAITGLSSRSCCREETRLSARPGEQSPSAGLASTRCWWQMRRLISQFPPIERRHVFRRVRLTRPGSLASSTDAFEVVECGQPEPHPGEVLVRVDHVSLDPYQKIRLRTLDAGATPPAGGVGQVVASRDAALPEGTWVTGELGWADHALVPGGHLTVIHPPPDIPLYHYVGFLGLSGLTA